jgi:hypothetical protein
MKDRLLFFAADLALILIITAVITHVPLHVAQLFVALVISAPLGFLIFTAEA